MVLSAARIRSRASPTALSGSPTSSNAGVPPEICTCTSTGTASMPEKAKVRTRAMVAAESNAVRARRQLLRWNPCLPEDGEGNGNAGPRRIAGPPYVTRVRATIVLLALLAVCIGGSAQAAPRRIPSCPAGGAR